MTVTPKKKDLAAEWREARLLHPLYSALAREFVIDLPACDDLEWRKVGVALGQPGAQRCSPHPISPVGPEVER